jgi:hypothetical protein
MKRREDQLLKHLTETFPLETLAHPKRRKKS